MTQVDIEKLILENAFELEDKEGNKTYEFGTGDIFRISKLLFNKMTVTHSSLQLKEEYKTDLEAYEEVLQELKEDEDFRLGDNSEWSKQIGFMEGKISILANL